MTNNVKNKTKEILDTISFILAFAIAGGIIGLLLNHIFPEQKELDNNLQQITNSIEFTSKDGKKFRLFIENCH